MVSQCMPVRVLTDLIDILHRRNAFIHAAALFVTLVPGYLNSTSSLNVQEQDWHLYLCTRTLIFCAAPGRNGISFSVDLEVSCTCTLPLQRGHLTEDVSRWLSNCGMIFSCSSETHVELTNCLNEKRSVILFTESMCAATFLWFCGET